MKFDILNRKLKQVQDEDEIVREHIPLHSRVLAPRINRVYQAWAKGLQIGRLPQLSNIRPTEWDWAWDRLNVFDASYDDPLVYRWIMFGYDYQMEGRSFYNARLSDLSSPAYRTGICEDYFAVKAMGIPMVHKVTAKFPDVVYAYDRILLPIASDGYHVDGLIGFSLLSQVIRTELPDQSPGGTQGVTPQTDGPSELMQVWAVA